MHDQEFAQKAQRLEDQLNDLLDDQGLSSITSKYGGRRRIPMRLANAFYSRVLLSAAIGRHPTYEEYEGMEFKEGDEVVYQAACFLYEKWRVSGLAPSVTNYCQFLNRLRDRSPCDAGKPLPDFRIFEKDIIQMIEEAK